MPTSRAFIALGANLPGKRRAIADAIGRMGELPRTRLIGCGKIRSTAPVGGPPDQGRFLNTAAEIETAIGPARLLAALLTIERIMGRDRTHEPHHGPRIIDLDLLLYGELVIESRGLILPHPRLHQRRFVLDPLCDLAPNLLHPILQKTMLDLRAAIPRT